VRVKGAAVRCAALKPVGRAPPPSVRGCPLNLKNKSAFIDAFQLKSRMVRCYTTTEVPLPRPEGAGRTVDTLTNHVSAVRFRANSLSHALRQRPPGIAYARSISPARLAR
jgi:hypothetical protein